MEPWPCGRSGRMDASDGQIVGEVTRQAGTELQGQVLQVVAMDENLCPQCGSKMVPRTNRKDQTKFWGCSQYPRCKGTRNVDGEARLGGPFTQDEADQRLPSERQRDNDRRRW